MGRGRSPRGGTGGRRLAWTTRGPPAARPYEERGPGNRGVEVLQHRVRPWDLRDAARERISGRGGRARSVATELPATARTLRGERVGRRPEGQGLAAPGGRTALRGHLPALRQEASQRTDRGGGRARGAGGPRAPSDEELGPGLVDSLDGLLDQVRVDRVGEGRHRLLQEADRRAPGGLRRPRLGRVKEARRTQGGCPSATGGPALPRGRSAER